MTNFYLIGLIGTLGSGKSTVRKMLEQLGARGIDADALAHVVMQRGSPTWRAIVETFGVDVLRFNGGIDRRKLGVRVFADTDALQRLESIVHPAVRALTKELLRENNQPVVVVEAIKLVEAGMHRWCDSLWAVTCSPDVQVERVMRSRNMREEDARARLAAQGSFEEKLQLAQIIIDNSGDEQSTRAQVENAWKTIRPELARDKMKWLLGLPPVAEAQPELAASPIGIPQAEPSAPPPVVEKPKPAAASKELQIRRSRRNDLDALSVALAKRENRAKPLTREEALKRFGERGYRIAITTDQQIVALAAWEAENLVACVREVWAESAEEATIALPRLFELIESEARELLCEVALLLTDTAAPSFVLVQAQTLGYEPQNLNALHPVWRQVAQERLQPGDQIWSKRLRTDMVTKPF